MKWRIAENADLDELTRLNRLLQQDEGSGPMEPGAARARLQRWLSTGYRAVIFEENGATVAYALFRATDPDTEGLDPGIFIRQFFVVRDRRREGIGRRAFEALATQLWPPGCGLLLDTKVDNSRAQHFWRSMGFADYQLTLRRDQHSPSPTPGTSRETDRL